MERHVLRIIDRAKCEALFNHLRSACKCRSKSPSRTAETRANKGETSFRYTLDILYIPQTNNLSEFLNFWPLYVIFVFLLKRMRKTTKINEELIPYEKIQICHFLGYLF